ncbi:hypothetical protein P152DRAFT_406502, partial [Eremomyces bilateralis CBS 781.70]
GYVGRTKAVIKTLGDIQKRALCLITGGFRTTAASALEIDAQVPPIKHTLQRAIESAFYRIRSSPLYPLIIQPRDRIHCAIIVL